jgi:hypothetical protein
VNDGRKIAELARDEAVALHAFFVAWFLDQDDAPDFETCERAFAPDFRMVTPDGTAHDLAETLARLRAARGTAKPGFRIDVLDPRPVWIGDGAVLLEYVEQQYRDGRSTRRRSTGMFTLDPSAPRGVKWRHLQETWIGAAQATKS